MRRTALTLAPVVMLAFGACTAILGDVPETNGTTAAGGAAATSTTRASTTHTSSSTGSGHHPTASSTGTHASAGGGGASAADGGGGAAATGGASATGGAGGAGGAGGSQPTCVTCIELGLQGADPTKACPGSGQKAADLANCVCGTSTCGSDATKCANFCMMPGQVPNDACQDCAVTQCFVQTDACLRDTPTGSGGGGGGGADPCQLLDSTACLDCESAENPNGAMLYNAFADCVLCQGCWSICDGSTNGCPGPAPSPLSPCDHTDCGGCQMCAVSGMCGGPSMNCQASADCQAFILAIGGQDGMSGCFGRPQ